MTFLISVSTFFITSSYAIGNLANCNLHHRKSDSVVHLASAISGYEREDLDKYALERKEDVKDYSATGMLSCYDGGGGFGTAQLVTKKGAGTKNVITTAGHNLFNKSCELADINKCYFIPLFEPTRKVAISIEMENIGGCLPADGEAQNDWAIVKLKESIPMARPYLVPDKPLKIKDHLKFTQVTAFAENYPGKSGHAVDCESRDSFVLSNAPLVTTCSSGHGTSGSALLQKTKNRYGKNDYWFYGMAVGAPPDGIDGTEFKISGANPNYTVNSPLEGRFFERLNAVLADKQSTNN